MPKGTKEVDQNYVHEIICCGDIFVGEKRGSKDISSTFLILHLWLGWLE